VVVDLQNNLRAWIHGPARPCGKVAAARAGSPTAERRRDATGAAEALVPFRRLRQLRLVSELDGAPGLQPIARVRRSQRSNAETWTSSHHRRPPACSRPMPTSPFVPRRRSEIVRAFREWLRAGARACGVRPPRRLVAE